MELVIIIEGGAVRSVLSPEPEKIKNLKITFVDYNTEDSDANHEVMQTSGAWVDAHIVQTMTVDQLDLQPFIFRKKS